MTLRSLNFLLAHGYTRCRGCRVIGDRKSFGIIQKDFQRSFMIF